MEQTVNGVCSLIKDWNFTLQDAESVALVAMGITKEGLYGGAVRRIWRVADQHFVCMTKKVDPLIAKGGFKKVKMAFSLNNPRAYVVLTSSTASEKEKRCFVREKRAWSECEKLGVSLPLIATFTTKTDKGKERGYMLTERADDDLYGFLKAHTPSLSQCLIIARKITHNVALLHENKWVHGDLKPDNILLCDQSVYLTDFGFTKHIEEKGPVSGSRYYLAPELIKTLYEDDKRVNTFATDAWSLGCILYTIYHPQHARMINVDSRLLHLTQQEVFDHLQHALGKIPSEVSAIIQGLLTIDPDHRMTVQTAKDMFASVC